MDPFGSAKHPLGTSDLEHNEEAERNRQTICYARNMCGLCSSLPQFDRAKQRPTKPPDISCSKRRSHHGTIYLGDVQYFDGSQM